MGLDREGQRGQVLVMFCLLLTLIIAFVAMAIDVGLIFVERREMQNAADAAALAGAARLPPEGTAAEAIALAREYAKKNGFEDGVNGVNVEVVTPYEGDPGKIEVKISGSQPAYFAVVLGKTNFPVKARGVGEAMHHNGANAAFLLLNETACKAFDKSGSSNLTITNGGGIMVNSSCDPSMSRTGSGNVTAEVINYYKPGGYVDSGSGSYDPMPTPANPRVADPFADLMPPDLEALGRSPNSGGTAKNPGARVLSSGNHTLRPGVYYGGLDIRSTADVTFLPGIYVMAGGGIKLTGSGTLNGMGVMFYNTFDPEKPTGAGACGEINLRGTANFNFSGPTDGPYKNMVLWQDWACTNTLKLEGGEGGIAGIIYAPNAAVDLSGSAGLGAIQVVADTADISGTGEIVVNFVPYEEIPLESSIRLDE